MVEKKQYYNQKVHAISREEAGLLFNMLSAKGKILDVACGSGDLGRHAPQGCTMYGFDHDVKVKSIKGYKEAKVVDLEKVKYLPYAKGFFDGVICKDILEHLDDPLAATQKIAAALRDGGRLLITVPNANPKNVWNDYTHRRGFTRGAIRMLCEDTGLKVIKISHSGGIPGFGILKLNRLANLLVNIPLLGMPFRTGWMVVCQR